MPGYLKIDVSKREGPFEMRTNHFHDSYEVYYLISGERYYFINERTYHLQKGDLVFIGRNELHKTGETGVNRHERILIDFNEPLFHPLTDPQEELLFAPFKRKYRQLRLQEEERLFVEGLLHSIIRETTERAQGYELYAKTLLQQLLLFAERRMGTRPHEALETASPAEQKVFEIAEYINSHYAEPLKLSDLARQFYISEYYLSRAFKKVTGFSYVEYVNTLRIREAQRLLRETGLKVTEVAERSGFDSIAHFGRLFKKVAGMSPLAFRRKANPALP